VSRAEELGEVLVRLQPPGTAAPGRPGSVARALYEGLAEGFGRVEELAALLVRESDPRSSAALLGEWERFLGLPSPCTAGDAQTIPERRAAVLRRLTAAAGSTPADIEALAALLGAPGTVTEYRAFVAGSEAGGALSNGPWPHTFTLHAPVATGIFFQAGLAGAGDALWAPTAASLECAILEASPAHVFGQVEYDLTAPTDYQPWDPATCRPIAPSAAPSAAALTLQET